MNGIEPTPESISPATPTAREAARRRTFAIISHPDAGKTTLTEKFLLYAGRVEAAGAVRGRKTRRAVASDWMELERQRGISVSSTALSFDYRGRHVNLLDTPGHQDFSEDTYRTLTAADSAVMVLDAAKGIETQTRKLFRVCAARRIPILTFVNKMDRPGRDPLDLLSELEQVLGLEAVPLNWPIGSGPEFAGVFDRQRQRLLIFQPTEGGSLRVPVREYDWPTTDLPLPEHLIARLRDDLELLDGAANAFDPARFLAGQQTPVFFGSGMTNFGIEPFLDAFLDLAPAPRPRPSDQGPVPPSREAFSGFVFKIQANLNPKHRDRVAFLRVCSGCYAPDLELTVARTGNRLRAKGAHRLFARDREEVESAYPGDVIGLADTGVLRLGDTLCEGATFAFEPLPEFNPECFAAIRCPDTSRRKQFDEGLRQLSDEGAVQRFDTFDGSGTILAAVGVLQFDVVKYRLESEYGTRSEISLLPYSAAAWLGVDSSALAGQMLPGGVQAVRDRRGRVALLSDDDFTLRYLGGKQPTWGLRPFCDDLFAPRDAEG